VRFDQFQELMGLGRAARRGLQRGNQPPPPAALVTRICELIDFGSRSLLIFEPTFAVDSPPLQPLTTLRANKRFFRSAFVTPLVNVEDAFSQGRGLTAVGCGATP
jgi:hypothetical protein